MSDSFLVTVLELEVNCGRPDLSFFLPRFSLSSSESESESTRSGRLFVPGFAAVPVAILAATCFLSTFSPSVSDESESELESELLSELELELELDSELELLSDMT